MWVGVSDKGVEKAKGLYSDHVPEKARWKQAVLYSHFFPGLCVALFTQECTR